MEEEWEKPLERQPRRVRGFVQPEVYLPRLQRAASLELWKDMLAAEATRRQEVGSGPESVFREPELGSLGQEVYG